MPPKLVSKHQRKICGYSSMVELLPSKQRTWSSTLPIRSNSGVSGHLVPTISRGNGRALCAGSFSNALAQRAHWLVTSSPRVRAQPNWNLAQVAESVYAQYQYRGVAQPVRASGSYPEGRWFESIYRNQQRRRLCDFERNSLASKPTSKIGMCRNP